MRDVRACLVVVGRLTRISKRAAERFCSDRMQQRGERTRSSVIYDRTDFLQIRSAVISHYRC